MSRTFVMGDIHGAHKALVQVLKRAAFDYENDTLIFLGDVADGWPETRECVDELLTIRNLKYILGNHDFWALEWMQTGFSEDLWLDQGGRATVKSYGKNVPASHVRLLSDSLPYLVVNNSLFVHAGFQLNVPLEEQSLQTFLWDRNLARIALDFHMKGLDVKITRFDAVFIGHTPTPFQRPIRSGDVWLMDTGAGWSGCLSMMDLDSGEIFSSDEVPSFYPGIEGRSKRK